MHNVLVSCGEEPNFFNLSGRPVFFQKCIACEGGFLDDLATPPYKIYGDLNLVCMQLSTRSKYVVLDLNLKLVI